MTQTHSEIDLINMQRLIKLLRHVKRALPCSVHPMA